MQKARIVVTGLTVFVLCAVFIGFHRNLNASETSASASDAAMCVPMGTIVLEAPQGVESTRSPVNFSHPKHYNQNCLSCHHTWTGEAPIQSCGTAGCHDLVKSPRNLKPEDVSEDALPIQYFKSAYHQKCIGCHKEGKLEIKKAELSGRVVSGTLPNVGPTGCNECHPK